MRPSLRMQTDYSLTLVLDPDQSMLPGTQFEWALQALAFVITP